jgi:putative oxidoreductase
MMITDQQVAGIEGLQPIGLLADKASRLVQTVALPSLVQLVMRVALAVPFWRSGILKWNDLLRSGCCS